MKKVLIGLAVVLISCVALAAVAPFVIDLNKYKGTILSKLDPYIAQEVDFQNIELTILRGLGAEIGGLRISDSPSFSKGDFLTLDNLRVRVQLLPLIRKRVQVKKVILNEPVVCLARDKAGRFNFEDLFVPGEEAPAENAPEPRDKPQAHEAEGKGPGILAALLVDEFKIRQGKISYRDEMLSPGRDPVTIDALDLEVQDVSLQRPISVSLAADLMAAGRQNVRFQGTVGPVGDARDIKKTPFDFKLMLQELILDGLEKRLPDGLAVKPVSGKIDMAFAASGSLAGKVASAGEINLRDLILQQTMPGGNSERSGRFTCGLSHQITVDYPGEQVLVEAGSLSINDNRVIFDGTVKRFSGQPSWDMRLTAEKFQPVAVMELFPMYAAKMPEGLKIKGPLDLKAESAGTRNEFAFSVNTDLKGMDVQYKNMFKKPVLTPLSFACRGVMDGPWLTMKSFELVFNNMVMTAPEEISINTEKPQFDVVSETRVASLAGWDTLVPMLSPYHLQGGLLLNGSFRGAPRDVLFDARLTSGRVDFHLPVSGDGKEPALPSPGVVEGIGIDIGGSGKAGQINGKCRASAEKGEVSSVPFQKFSTNLSYEPDQLNVVDFAIQAFQGVLNGAGQYKIRSGEWSFLPVFKNIAVERALDIFTEYGDDFSGLLSGSFQAKGNAAAEDKLPEFVKGDFTLDQGELKNFNLTDSIMEELFGLKGLTRSLAQKESKIERHGTTRFDSLRGKLEMKDDNLHFESLELLNIRTTKATDSLAIFKGDCSLETMTLDFKGRVILSAKDSEDLVEKSEALEALLNQEKRMVLPVTVKGPVNKPIPALDREYVLNALKEHYKSEAVDKGMEKLREKINLPEGTEKILEESAGKILDGLFGK